MFLCECILFNGTAMLKSYVFNGHLGSIKSKTLSPQILISVVFKLLLIFKIICDLFKCHKHQRSLSHCLPSSKEGYPFPPLDDLWILGIISRE